MSHRCDGCRDYHDRMTAQRALRGYYTTSTVGGTAICFAIYLHSWWSLPLTWAGVALLIAAGWCLRMWWDLKHGATTDIWTTVDLAELSRAMHTASLKAERPDGPTSTGITNFTEFPPHGGAHR